jgi:hypothetical protein
MTNTDDGFQIKFDLQTDVQTHQRYREYVLQLLEMTANACTPIDAFQQMEQSLPKLKDFPIRHPEGFVMDLNALAVEAKTVGLSPLTTLLSLLAIAIVSNQYTEIAAISTFASAVLNLNISDTPFNSNSNDLN